MSLPADLESSISQLRSKHAALVAAVNEYRSGTVETSRQDLLDMAANLHERIRIEEHTLLGQVARKSGMSSDDLALLRAGGRP